MAPPVATIVREQGELAGALELHANEEQHAARHGDHGSRPQAPRRLFPAPFGRSPSVGRAPSVPGRLRLLVSVLIESRGTRWRMFKRLRPSGNEAPEPFSEAGPEQENQGQEAPNLVAPDEKAAKMGPRPTEQQERVDRR